MSEKADSSKATLSGNTVGSSSSSLKITQSTSQNAKTLDVYWYVLNICIGTGSEFTPSLNNLMLTGI
jgi:hypothetical protein